MSNFGLNINIMSNNLFIWKNPFSQYYLKVSMSNATITQTGGNLTTSLTTIQNSGQFTVNYNGNNGQIKYNGSEPRKFMFLYKINITTTISTAVNYTFALRRANNQKFCFIVGTYPIASTPYTLDVSAIGYYTITGGGNNYGIVFNPNDIYLLYARKITGSTSVNANIEFLMVSY